MSAPRRRILTAVAATLGLFATARAEAQLRDHLACYRIRDPLGVRGVADVSTRFGDDAGCKLGRAKYYCEPAHKTVITSNRPFFPVVGRGLLDSRICYGLKCRNEAAAGFGGIIDQFGPHPQPLPRKGKLLCVPAVHGPPATAMDDLDDIKCYKARDLFPLEATVAVETLNLGLYFGCEVKRTRLFCTAAHTTIQSVNVGPLLPIDGSGADDTRICYGLTCQSATAAPQIVSDRFGSRTVTGLKTATLCTPAPGLTATTTTVTTTTATTTTLPPGTDPNIVCQRTIEADGMMFARLRMDHIVACANGVPGTISGCAGSLNLQEGIALNQWRSDAQAACAGIDVRGVLGHAEPCGRAPRLAAAPVTDVASAIDCLASGVSSHLLNSAEVLYADAAPATNQCHRTLGNGAIDVLRTALEQVYTCTQQPGATSVAACYAPDPSTWRAQAVIDCAGINPYSTFGYRQTCDRHTGPVFPGACASRAYPCTFNNSSLSTGQSLLDCLGCQLGEAVLGVAGDLFGANLCCIGGTCNRVLTRVACFEAGGTPARYGMSSLPGVSTGGAHGIEIGPDGNLYMTGPGNVVTRVALPGGAQTTVGSTPFFPTGVAIDTAGNVYVTNRCVHTLTKIAPGGVATTFAGTGTPGHSGDEGPATAAQIAAPDGIAVDAAGNVYFTESRTLSLICSTSSPVGTERVRMVDTNGVIHTIAGGGAGPVGGPALGALFSIPYGLRLAPDGTLLIGEAGAQRALRIDAGGTLRLVAGRSGGAVGYHAGYRGPASQVSFYQNCGLAEDPDGNVMIGPMEDNRIALADSLGSVIAIAGTGDGSTFGAASGDGGPALLGQAGCPEDVTIGPDGTVYFTDLQTQRIRVLTREPF
jgi:hypothetical protein